MVIFFITYFVLYSAVNILFTVIISIKYNKRLIQKPLVYPKVSILVAARNEEHNILDTLNSLVQQDYPNDFLEILIGNDQSEDNTHAVVSHFIEQNNTLNKHLNIQIINIKPNQSHLKGKQNVLAQLADIACGELLIITDADITHHPKWILQIVNTFEDPKIHLVSGPTIVKGDSLFARLQSLDWLVGVAVIKAMDCLKLPITAVGNNMAVRRSTYEKLGGYRSLDFSITEDYILFAHFIKSGYKHKWLYNNTALTFSKPMENFNKMTLQRKRWVKGGLDGPWYASVLYTFYMGSLSLLVVSALGFIPYNILFLILGLKVISDIIFIFIAGQKVNQSLLWLFYPIYFFYALGCSIALSISLFNGKPVVWKERVYSKK